MYQKRRLLEREILFTRAYQNNINRNKAIRELECLRVQIPLMFLPMANPKKDLFVGTVNRAFVGYYNQLEGDEIDKTGYCINESACEEAVIQMKQDGSYSKEEIHEAEEMIDFWKKENTNTKIRNRFTPEMICGLASDQYLHDCAAAYPLYRIAGGSIDHEKLLKLGLNGLIELIRNQQQEAKTQDSIDLYTGMIGTLQIVRKLCSDYMGEISKLSNTCNDDVRESELHLMYDSLEHIMNHPPKTLHQAIQLVLLYMLACRATEVGRLDDYLGSYYIHDLQTGEITRELAVRMVDSFFTLIECGMNRDSRAIIGGYGRKNSKNSDEFALVILDAVEQRVGCTLPQLSLRVTKDLDERVYDKSLDLLESGLTFPLLYNDEVNVPSMMRAMDVPKEVAQQYSFFGCGEYMLAHRSIGTPNILINMAKILELTLNNGVDAHTGKVYGFKTGEITDDITFEELMNRLQQQVDYFAKLTGQFKELVYDVCNEEASLLMFSILYDDCIKRGRALLDGGIYHLGGTVETYGNITAADSLAAIKQVVFDQQAFTITHLLQALKADFVEFKKEQQLLLSAKKYGNDWEEADEIAIRVHEMICHSIRNQRTKTRLDSLLVVVINNNMNIVMGSFTQATADGRKAKEFLSNGNSAYNGNDKEGISALMRSLTKLDTSIHGGANQNLKFSSKMFGENKAIIKALLAGFFELGGQQTNLSVVNQGDLEDAMLHPENHENLIIRVGGFTARFIHLDRKTQQEVLSRTAY